MVVAEFVEANAWKSYVKTCREPPSVPRTGQMYFPLSFMVFPGISYQHVRRIGYWGPLM